MSTRLHKWRKARGYTLAQVGSLIGTSGQTVHRYEQETAIPSRETMNKIIRVTNGEVTPNDFFRDALAQVAATTAASCAPERHAQAQARNGG